ncbi:hypothetical protein I79_015750 [Cricetulus griseus]|uniref:Uncharacterized protein n=1 Tax=Cricetulus griseus TaxID=10029 RepID=G3HXM2_CRIGR|nr:hypothetical protein I79_015750 [Cricetulus griseus]
MQLTWLGRDLKNLPVSTSQGYHTIGMSYYSLLLDRRWGSNSGPYADATITLPTVIADLGCQSDWIWNQLTDKVSGLPVTAFLISEKTHHKCG